MVKLAKRQVGYGACVGDWDRARRWMLPAIGDRPFVGLAGQTSIAVAYNTILDAYLYANRTVWRGNLGAVILLHDDLEIIDPDAEAKFLDALDLPDVVIAGVCGGTSDASLAWWNGPTVGHQQINGRTLEFGDRPGHRSGEVAILEGSILAFSPWAVRSLRFDTRYPGFHSYDEICLSARASGKRVWAADVDTYHHVDLGFKSEASAAAWARGEAIFQQKWHGGADAHQPGLW